MPDAYEPQPAPLNPNNPSATIGKVPHPADGFGKVPHSNNSFGGAPNTAESFGYAPNPAETLPPLDWRESYTLTVREVARLFETAGVARSERSIVNWCQKNRHGIPRLDAYFDPNDRRYFITRQSVDTIISEEKARAAKANAEPHLFKAEAPNSPDNADAEAFRKTPPSSAASKSEPSDESSATDLIELRKENFDLKITNRGKDYFIDQLKSEREILLKQLVDSSQRVGQLETKLLQLRHPMRKPTAAD